MAIYLQNRSTRWMWGNNRRYKVTKKESSKIGWHKTEETGVHDWEGYIRVPEDGTYNFTIQIDDNGYLEINGEKVAELTGSHSSTSVSGSKELKKGLPLCETAS